MNTSGFIGIVLALGLGFLGGYRYATKPVPDANPEGPRIIYRDRPITPPKPEHIQSPEARIVHVVAELDTVCLAADASLTRPHARGYGLEGVKRGSGLLRTLFSPAVTYVDPSTQRLAVTRTRRGSIRIPYTWQGRTIVDEYAFYPPKWNLLVELEGLAFGDSFAALNPQAFQGSAMTWLRLRRIEIGVGARVYVQDDATDIGSVAGVRYRAWSLR